MIARTGLAGYDPVLTTAVGFLSGIGFIVITKKVLDQFGHLKIGKDISSPLVYSTLPSPHSLLFSQLQFILCLLTFHLINFSLLFSFLSTLLFSTHFSLSRIPRRYAFLLSFVTVANGFNYLYFYLWRHDMTWRRRYWRSIGTEGRGSRFTILPSFSLLFSHSSRLFFCLFVSVYLCCSISTICRTPQFNSIQFFSYPTVLSFLLSYPFLCPLPIGRTHNLRYDPALSHRGYRNRGVIRYVRARTLFSFIIFHLLSLLD